MKMRALGAFTVVGLVFAACGGSTTEVGGVAGKGASDAGLGGSSGSGGSAGSGGEGCPADWIAAVGKPCAPEGKACSGGSCNPCSFCNSLLCMGGKWQQMEAFPDPSCNDAGTTCGGLADADCPAGFWCDYPEGCGFADSQGVCKAQPDGCFTDCPGVCGCDGKPYCNECEANKAGVDVNPGDTSCKSDGGLSCGGIAGLQCPSGYFCDYASCDNDDSLGTCVQKPASCDQDCSGVCGCDGKFYCSKCAANALGVDVSEDGKTCGGDTGQGMLCSGDDQCGGGLKCCYPCGIAGCENKCLKPDPNGDCPLFP